MRQLIFLVLIISLARTTHAQIGFTNLPDRCQIEPNNVPVTQGGGEGGYPVFDAAVAMNTANMLDQAAATQTNTDSLNQLAMNKCRAERLAEQQDQITGSEHGAVDNALNAGPESQAPGAQ